MLVVSIVVGIVGNDDYGGVNGSRNHSDSSCV